MCGYVASDLHVRGVGESVHDRFVGRVRRPSWMVVGRIKASLAIRLVQEGERWGLYRLYVEVLWLGTWTVCCVLHVV